MKDRDEELDKLEKELTAPPFIERPKHLDLKPGALCWLNGERRCGADCVAFNAEALDDHGLEEDGPQKCVVLVYLGQTGLAAITKVRAMKTPAPPMTPPPGVKGSR